MELFFTLFLCHHKVYKDNFTSASIAWFLSSFSLCYIANTNLVASAHCSFVTTMSTCGRTSDIKGNVARKECKITPCSLALVYHLCIGNMQFVR
jgi:hypothetical protein